MLSSRGFSVPVEPRTWMVRSPCLTESGPMVERSTGGAAGLRRETRKADPAKTMVAMPAHKNIWRCFFFLRSGRAISMSLTKVAVAVPKKNHSAAADRKGFAPKAGMNVEKTGDRFRCELSDFGQSHNAE